MQRKLVRQALHKRKLNNARVSCESLPKQMHRARTMRATCVHRYLTGECATKAIAIYYFSFFFLTSSRPTRDKRVARKTEACQETCDPPARDMRAARKSIPQACQETCELRARDMRAAHKGNRMPRDMRAPRKRKIASMPRDTLSRHQGTSEMPTRDLQEACQETCDLPARDMRAAHKGQPSSGTQDT